MKGNDLGNVVVPRDVLVFEGLLGLLPDEKIARQEEKFRRRKKWEDAVACYEINELLARKIWQVTWDYNLQVDLVTHIGREFATALEHRMEVESMPFRAVWYENPNVLARGLAVQPDIRTVYTANENHQFTFGKKGRIIHPTTAHLYFGAL